MVTNMIYRNDEKGNGRKADPNGRVDKNKRRGSERRLKQFTSMLTP